MRSGYFAMAFLLIFLGWAGIAGAQTAVFINELHYDNSGADTGEGVEIAGPAGTDLSGWSVVLYNGSATQLKVYGTIALSGVIPDLSAGYGVLAFFKAGIQNGSPDGLALVDNSNTVIQFLSYEGTFTPVDGPAAGMLSTDIGVSESGSTPVGHSLQLGGSGADYEDFTWNSHAPNTFGAVNSGQTFVPPVVDTTPPTCQLLVYDPGPPLALELGIQDGESGLAQLEVLVLTNGTLEVPAGSGQFYAQGDIVSFSPPTTTPMVIRGEKVNQSQSATLVFKLTDAAGNSVTCDPVYTRLTALAPEQFTLEQNYPNPFNPVTRIEFGLPPGEQTPVNLAVFDLTGRRVKTLIDEPMTPGRYSVEWDGTGQNGQALAGGVYFYRLRAGTSTLTRRMLLLK